MHLTPREIDKLMVHQAGVLAQKRLARGLRLNYVEAVALIAAQLLEFIRDGHPVAASDGSGPENTRPCRRARRRGRDDRRGAGRRHVSGRHEARDRPSPDRGRARRSRARALRQLPRRSRPARPRARRATRSSPGVPGEVIVRDGEIVINEGRETIDAAGRQPRRPAHSGGQPLSLRRDQPRAGLRPPRRLRNAPRHPRRNRRAVRAWRNEDGDAGGDRRRAGDSRRQRVGERPGDQRERSGTWSERRTKNEERRTKNQEPRTKNVRE